MDYNVISVWKRISKHQINPICTRMKVASAAGIAIVQSSKFIGRTFLLGNYNALHLYPSGSKALIETILDL